MKRNHSVIKNLTLVLEDPYDKQSRTWQRKARALQTRRWQALKRAIKQGV